MCALFFNRGKFKGLVCFFTGNREGSSSHSGYTKSGACIALVISVLPWHTSEEVTVIAFQCILLCA